MRDGVDACKSRRPGNVKVSAGLDAAFCENHGDGARLGQKRYGNLPRLSGVTQVQPLRERRETIMYGFDVIPAGRNFIESVPSYRVGLSRLIAGFICVEHGIV